MQPRKSALIPRTNKAYVEEIGLRANKNTDPCTDIIFLIAVSCHQIQLDLILDS